MSASNVPTEPTDLPTEFPSTSSSGGANCESFQTVSSNTGDFHDFKHSKGGSAPRYDFQER